MTLWMRCLRAVLIACAGLGAVAASAAERTVVLVMFDGFSPAMADATKTPNLDRIKKEGAWSRHLVPAYPTISLTNHTTFTTGCWPEHHGIVQNNFYDPKKGAYSQDGDADWMTGCETVWQAAERQGMRAAALNFANRWGTTKGKLASYANPMEPWEQLPSDEAILEQALAHLKNNGPTRPRLIALYFRGPDHEAHFKGITAPETLAEVRRADAIVGKLMAGIKALPAGREGTLIVGTDHGMMDVGSMVNILRILNKHGIDARDAGDGATLYLYLNPGENADRVGKALAEYDYAFDVYRPADLPVFMHLGKKNPRIGDLVLHAKPPYWVVGSASIPWYGYLLGIPWWWSETFTPDFGGVVASHGYDPSIQEMHGIFYAWGSGIASGKEIAQLDMIDVHPTVMSLLGLEPGKPVDGKIVTEALAPAVP